MSDKRLPKGQVPKKLSQDHFENLGEQAPSSWDTDEFYRFELVRRHLSEGSVLDIGAYYCDFLKLVDDSRDVYGTEINQTRVDIANEQIKEDIVELGFRNGDLQMFDENSIDNVVCMEVLEHVPNLEHAIAEICRVAKSQVVITVPYKEQIQTELCIHCDSYTPRNGHVHTFNEHTFDSILPQGYSVIDVFDFAPRILRLVARRLPLNMITFKILRQLESLHPGDGTWLLVKINAD